jgi:hypothetical protein
MLKKDESELTQKEGLVKVGYAPFETAQWEQYYQFIADKTAPAKEKSDAIRQQMDAILADAISHAHLSVELAKAEAERAHADYEARDYGLRHLTDIQQRSDQRVWIEREKQLEQLRHKVYEEQLKADSGHADIY